MASLIVKSAIKGECKTVNVSSDFYDKLDKKVKLMIKEAVERAKSNKRTTVMGKDL